MQQKHARPAWGCASLPAVNNAYSGVEGVGTLHLYLDIGDKIYDRDFLVPQVVRLDTGSAYDILMENNGVATLSSHYPG